MDHILSFVQVTERAALACYPLIGKGKPKEADQKAVDAMREEFNKLPMDIRIVIGEGERDQAPRLYTGEQLGDPASDLKIDVAVDPLEGTALCAEAKPGALSVMSISLRGYLFKAPDIYMDKIACGSKAKSVINLKAEPKDNITQTAKALGKNVEEITVGVLDRPRHKKLIQKIRDTKAKICLIEDGDVALAMETALHSSTLDLLMGSGGAPEGVLAASALKCLDGGFQGQLVYKNEEERHRAQKVGVENLDKVWQRDELVSSDLIFCATGVTSGSLVEGLKKEADFYIVETLVLTLNHIKKIKSFYQDKLRQ